ncbi:MAG: Ig-like domain-containing protein [Bacteroidia bacterium]
MRADGYPLEIPYNNGTDPEQSIRTLMYFGELEDKYPGGSYRLIASGQGRIRLWGAASGSFRCPVDTLVFVDSSFGGVALEIDTSLAADPVRDIHFVMPGFHNNYDSVIFHPNLTDFIQDFQAIRFMDWMKTNGSPVVSWSDRNTPENYSQTTDNGVAYEYIAAMCNRFYKDPWICIPHQADSMYIVNMARFLRDSLDPCLTIYVEYSNEVWNGIFAQNQYAANQASALGYIGQPWELSWKYTARRSADIFHIFLQEFGADSSRFVRVIPAWAANDWVTDYIIDRFEEPQYNPWGVKADAVAIAPYFGGGIADRIASSGMAASTTVNNLLDSMSQALYEAYAWMDACKAVADTHNLSLLAYEGGQHLVTYAPYNNDTAYVNKLLDVNRHARMGDFYCDYFDYWFDSTQADLFCIFSSHGNYSKYGAWGIKENYEDTLSAKYRAIQQCVFAYNQIDPPLAVNDQDTMVENTSHCFAVLDNDSEPNGDPFGLVEITRPPAFGSASIQGDSICYTPAATYIGFDTIVYKICDPGCPPQCSEALLIVEVKQESAPLNVFDDDLTGGGLSTLTIYPNPSTGIFSVKSSESLDIQLFDLTGKQIDFLVEQLSDREKKIKVSDYRGLLLLEVTGKKGRETIKLWVN